MRPPAPLAFDTGAAAAFAPPPAGIVLLLFASGQGAKAYAPLRPDVSGVMRLQSASAKVIELAPMSKITSRCLMIEAPITVPCRWLSKTATQ